MPVKLDIHALAATGGRPARSNPASGRNVMCDGACSLVRSQSVRKPSASSVGSIVSREQSGAGRRRERHRDLELWIIAPAGALESIRPAMVEDIFAIAVRFAIAGNARPPRCRHRHRE